MPRRRRHSKEAAEEQPLFDETAQQETPKAEPKAVACAVPDCKLPAAEGGKFCVVHEVMAGWKKKTQAQGRAADKKGEVVVGVLWRFGASVLDAVTPIVAGYVAKAAEDPRAAAGNIFNGARTAAGAAGQAYQNWGRQLPVQPKADPFYVLGLAQTCTVEDVRKMQRKLAALYHSDRADDSVVTAKLVEINAAAAECLKILKG